ncbi:MAG: SH3 domain-containing protein [Dehalococcoidia bacterium]|nr:SH3 domain-containing protein [Dehalococcoidia bacterium]
MKFPLSPETRSAVVKNPILLAGLAVVVLLGVIAAALVLIDSARGGNAQTPRVVIDQSTATVGPTSKTAEAVGVHGTANQVTAVRSAPGNTTPVLGTIPQDADVVIDGRTTDSKWYRVIFPQESELHGWIDASMLDVTGDAAALVVATAEPPVPIEVPTEPPTRTPRPSEITPEPSPTQGTPTASPLPDLVVNNTPTIVGGKLVVTVVNQGKGPMQGNLVVAVFTQDESRLIGGITVPGVTIAPGQSLDVPTGVAIAGEQTLLIVVDPNGAIDETDNTNNRMLIAVSTGPLATPTAPLAPPPSAPAR